jgi:hypothetical protein
MAQLAAHPAPHRARTRSSLTNRPLAGVNLASAEGRRLRDLYQLAAAEIGGKLSLQQQIICMNWARAQLRMEQTPTAEFSPLLAAELRHLWRAVQSQKRRREGADLW